MTLYSKQTWVNGSAGGTPISAARLAHIEEGIETAAEEVTALIETGATFTEFSNITVVAYTSGAWPARPALPAGQRVLWINTTNATLPPAGVGGYDPNLDIALTALT